MDPPPRRPYIATRGWARLTSANAVYTQTNVTGNPVHRSGALQGEDTRDGGTDRERRTGSGPDGRGRRAGAGQLPPGPVAARQPVLHVGLHHGDQQHAAAAPAQRVRPRLHADHPDRVGLVHRVFRGLDPGGEADRPGRLPARPGDRPRHHGDRHLRDGAGLPGGLLRDHPVGPVRDRERHHPAAGRRQPLRGGDRPGRERLGAAQPRPGVQLPGGHPGAAVRRHPDPRPLHLGQRRGGHRPDARRAAGRRAVGAAALPDRGGGADRARRGDRPVPAAGDRRRIGRTAAPHGPRPRAGRSGATATSSSACRRSSST